MTTKSKYLLWRVDWNHRAGYQAPYRFVWAENKKEAGKLAKESSRLADFPEFWSYRLTEVTPFRKPNKGRKSQIIIDVLASVSTSIL